MKHEVIQMEEKIIVGMEYRGKNEHDEIVDLWKVFMKRFEEIDGYHPEIMYGLCYMTDKPGEFGYLAGVEVKSTEDIPSGMIAKTLPGRRYASFLFEDELSAMKAFWDKIYTTYLPANNMKMDFGVSFELYDERFPKTGACDICIPVQGL